MHTHMYMQRRYEAAIFRESEVYLHFLLNLPLERAKKFIFLN